MNLILSLLCDALRQLFGIGGGAVPEKSDIADLIDRRLGPSNGRDDGRIIRIKQNGYQYYITRSPIPERREH
jgi:hypothetical protein